VINVSEGHQHICKINVITSQTVMVLILHVGGSARIDPWILGHYRLRLTRASLAEGLKGYIDVLEV